jgi:hypothetical protein
MPTQISSATGCGPARRNGTIELVFDTAEAWRRGFAAYTAQLDPALFHGSDARSAFDALAQIERLAGAAKVLFARRVAETNGHRSDGELDPARWLAKQTGCTYGAAADQLKTAERMDALPRAREAFVAGQLSETQARHIADAATADPSKEHDLIDMAAVGHSIGEIVAEARRIKSAASDQDAAHARLYRQRRVRRHVDTDGAFRLELVHTPEIGAEINALLEPFIDAIFRRSGERESRAAYAADALVEVLRAGASGERSGLHLRRVRDAKVIVHVPYETFLAGGPVNGRTCEIDGVGPVPVSVVDDLLSTDPFLAAVVTKGTDIASVTHFGRRPNALQITALEARGMRCTRLGCDRTARLEADHRVRWETSKHTRIDELDLLCIEDHRRKDVEGWRLEPGTGRRRLLPPDHPDLARDGPAQLALA